MGCCTLGAVKNGVRVTLGNAAPEHASYAPGGGPTGPDVSPPVLLPVSLEPAVVDVVSAVLEPPEPPVELPLVLEEPEPPVPPVVVVAPLVPVVGALVVPVVGVTLVWPPVVVEEGSPVAPDVESLPSVILGLDVSLLQANNGATTAPPSTTRTSDFLMTDFSVCGVPATARAELDDRFHNKAAHPLSDTSIARRYTMGGVDVSNSRENVPGTEDR